MPSKNIKIPSIFNSLTDRRDRLRSILTQLGTSQVLWIPIETGTTEEDLPCAIIRSSVRVRLTNYHFSIWEDFRDVDGTPFLYGFKYSLMSQDPGIDPFFRYECHPDVDDPQPDNNNDTDDEDEDNEKQNPYSVQPHFHPHSSLTHPISHLHYPFHRAERNNIVFAIISWIEVDLVNRFYKTGRVRI